MSDLWLMVVLFVFGGLLMIIELVIPGFGVPGIAGIVALISGVIVGSSVLTSGQLAIVILLVFFIIIVMVVLLYRSLTKNGQISKKLSLKSKAAKEEGYTSNKNSKDMVGKEGIAITALRPSGSGEFDDVNLDVVADGQFIPKGSKIRVAKVEGFKILVQLIEHSDTIQDVIQND